MMDTEPWLITSVPFSIQLDGGVLAAVSLRRAGSVRVLPSVCPEIHAVITR